MDSDLLERPLPTLINRSSKSKTLVVKECAGSGSGEVHTGLRLSHGGIDREVLYEAGYVPSNSEKHPLGVIISIIQIAFHATPEFTCSQGAVEELQLCFYEYFKAWILNKEKKIDSKAPQGSRQLPRHSLLLTSLLLNADTSVKCILWILGFLRENFAELPTEDEITQFFQTILYQGEIFLPRLFKSNLKPEWDIFFDTLAKVFAPTTRKNFNVISSLLQKIGFCIAHNRPVNFGKLILQAILTKLGPLRSRSV
ncbi:hypothetical protein ACET3Z_031493 [Daucus carota]